MEKKILNNWSWKVGFKTADLIQKSKHKFELIVRVIINKYYIDLFCFLSFLPLAIELPSFAVRIFDLLLILD